MNILSTSAPSIHRDSASEKGKPQVDYRTPGSHGCDSLACGITPDPDSSSLNTKQPARGSRAWLLTITPEERRAWDAEREDVAWLISTFQGATSDECKDLLDLAGLRLARMLAAIIKGPHGGIIIDAILKRAAEPLGRVIAPVTADEKDGGANG